MERLLVSACLLGRKCRYDGSDCRQDGLLRYWHNQGANCKTHEWRLASPLRPISELKFRSMEQPCTSFHPENGLKVESPLIHPERCNSLQGAIIPFCPEVEGGLSIPRPAAEIERGDADAVLRGRAQVRTAAGADVSEAFIQGAERALAECRRHHIRIAVLKEGSPSCGVCEVNDGAFTGAKIPGRGVTARLLERHGIRVFSERMLNPYIA